ncbi:MAG: tetratricopeptide repeat protein [Candidatus Heimdallarchaeaceae archaeon]
MHQNSANSEFQRSIRNMAIITGALLLLGVPFGILSKYLQIIAFVWIYSVVFAISFISLMIFLLGVSNRLSFYLHTSDNSKTVALSAIFVVIYVIPQIIILLLTAYYYPELCDILSILTIPLGLLSVTFRVMSFKGIYSSLKDFGYKGLMAFAIYGWSGVITCFIAPLGYFWSSSPSAGEEGGFFGTILNIGFWVDILLLTTIAIVLIAQADKFATISKSASTVLLKELPSAYAPIIVEETVNKEETVKALNNVGHTFYSHGRYKDALEIFQAALNVSREIGYKEGEATCLNNIARIHDSWTKSKETLQNFQKALKAAKELGNKNEEMTYLNNIGEILLYWGKIDEAMQNFQAALNIAKEMGNKSKEATYLNNIGEIFCYLGRYGEALKNFQEALKIAKIWDRKTEAAIISNMGIFFRYLGRYEEAIKNYQKALKIAKKIGDKEGEAIYSANIAAISHFWKKNLGRKTYNIE